VVWLAGWNRQPVPDDRPSMAVLAFESNIDGSEHAQLARRLTEGVTSELARLGTVSVASYTSAMQFAGQRRPMREISEALNARFVIEASVDDEGTGVLVVVRIVNTATDRKMWVADFRGARDDVRGISQRIAFDASAAVREASR
jgi:adenylate cyclase